ncbi:pentapeptide repeat-containing protein [bacterium]|nr:pentapeptide repeat-containing protein [bacterium]
MADPRQYQYLLDRLARADGCQSWQRFKSKARWIDLSTSDLSGRDLSGYDLSGINLSTALLGGACLRGTDFSGANLSFADLRGADLRGARLEHADLGSANLHEACLSDANLASANLRGARLINADLLGADLGGANLAGADLRGATLRYADMRVASVESANLAEANISGAVVPEGSVDRLKTEFMAETTDRLFRPLPHQLTGVEPEPEPVVAAAAAPEIHAAKPEVQTVIELEPEPRKKEKPAENVSAPFEIPVRTAEPDLNTLQGCALVLGISPDANQVEIVRAFRRKAKIFHPDKVRNLNEEQQALATEEFHRVLVAYERMTGRERRPLVGIVWVPGVPRYSSPYEYSIEHYEALVAANPNNINLLYNLAWKYFDEGEADKAYAGFQRVLAIDPNDEDAIYNLMIVRLYIELLLPSPEFRE